MSKKASKSKTEEALAFLDDLDKLGEEDQVVVPSPTSTGVEGATPAARTSLTIDRAGTPKASMDIPRKSVDSSRSGNVAQSSTSAAVTPTSTKTSKGNKKALTGNSSTNSPTIPAPKSPSVPSKSTTTTTTATEEDPEAALAYLQAQIDQKRPISRVQTPTNANTSGPIPRPSTPSSATIGSILPAPTTSRKSLEQTRSTSGTPINEPSSPTLPSSSTSGGWGFKPSFWSSALQTAKSTASSAYVQASQVASAAQSAAIAQAEKTTGVKVNVSDLAGLDLRGLNLEELRKAGSGGLEALKNRVGEGVKGVDLERLRNDILAQTSHALNELINTVAPPISEHEVVQVWMTHRMKGYDGVESVVYSGVMKMMEQTSSSELEVFFLPSDQTTMVQADRSINPLEGWEAGWAAVEKDLEGLKMRSQSDERKGEPNPDLPVSTVPVYLHLQPVLVPLAFPEPPSSKEADASSSSTSSSPPKHLTFIVTLHDDQHGLKHSTVTQFSPADWLEVEYERSDWVEERLVDVIRVGVEIVVQEYVAVRMGLKAKSMVDTSVEKETEDEPTEETVAKEAGVGT